MREGERKVDILWSIMLALRTFKALAAESSRHSNFWVLLGYKYGKENVQSVDHYHIKKHRQGD